MADTRLLPVPDGLDGLRLDVAISRLLGFSRTAAADLIDAGHVSVDGADAARSAKVRGGSLLEVTIPEPDVPSVAPMPVEGLVVLYDDADLVVIDKPVGVVAHPSPGWTGPTVTQGLAAMGYRLASSGAAERQGIVHRLDAGTTGAMVVAKSERAYSALKRAFKARTVDKRYAALVQGHPDPTSGTIDAPIDRHPSADYKFAVVASGRPSVTHYETVEAHRAATLLDVRLETGRPHQIRVHMAAVRHPCVGDLTYGADPTLAKRLGLSRQWLHARELGFEHPGTGEWLAVTSPFPPDLQHALDVLRDES
ncbi:MAG: RluA family pseudouridine synthase [Jatrophihabitantaceae bacterium]